MLAAARPDVAVFFTGPSGYYTWETEQQFPGMKQIDVEGYDRRALVRLTHEGLPQATFRSYHPNYLRQTKRWDLISAIGAEARRVLGTT